MGRLRVAYRLSPAPGETAERRARAIALEQTVELPERAVPAELAQRVAGRVESVEPAPAGGFRAVISYDEAVVGGEIPQLLNLLFGNVSLQHGVVVAAVEWPPSLLAAFPGPRAGVAGLRALCHASPDRPLVAAALKPLGLDAAALARRCHDLALAGIDLIKDDHGLADQAPAPFAERVARCQEATALANARTGGHGLYVPNLSAPAPLLDERAEHAVAAGCRAGLIAPLLVGLDAVRAVAERHGLALLAHPALAGAFFHPDHGIAPEVLLGQIFRIAGSDGVIFPDVGGRFPFSASTCAAIRDALRASLGALRPSFAVPAGGIDVAHAREFVARHGRDTILLIGGSLYEQGDLVAAGRRLVEAVGDASR